MRSGATVAASHRVPDMSAPVHRLPAGVIPKYPFEVELDVTGAAVLDVVRVPAADVVAVLAAAAAVGAGVGIVVDVAAKFGGAAEFFADLRTEVDLAIVGAGAFTADTITVVPVNAPMVGAGALIADVIPMPAAVAAYPGAGVMVADIGPVGVVAAAAAGDGGMSAVLGQSTVVVAAPVAAAGSFDAAVEYVVITFKPMRMNKSGAQAITGTPTQLTGWVVDGSYPGTVIVSNQLQMSGSGTNKTIAGAVACSSNFYGTATIQLKKNNVNLGSAFTGSHQTTVSFSLPGQTLADGDLIGVWISTSNAAGNPVANPSGSYLSAA